MTAYLNSTKIVDLCHEVGEENLPVLLSIFLDELSGYQQVLSGDPEELECPLSEISHALKSSAASFGADTLCEMAVSFDARVKAGEKINTSKNRESILSCLENTIREYNQLSAGHLT
ncbi:phosphorelay protein [Vibrio sp. HA2012]|uniref:Hpt domain-containing protein n=1 Tax=Vibrio sp. HA2012 TaxID=1971595 RepID=UPI000C2C3A7D|nr:Hpt domain-containing protein [Vibrio sp. HA2012]PJC85359.1 phosphorelay protein [Vibrio sp. HA2012]